MKQTEHELQNLIIDYLTLKGFYVIRLNSGLIPSFYKGKQRMIRLSKKGTPDLMAFKNIFKSSETGCLNHVKLVFIEVKLSGKYATQDQIAMMDELMEKGALCYVIHSLPELQKVI